VHIKLKKSRCSIHVIDKIVGKYKRKITDQKEKKEGKKLKNCWFNGI